MPEPAGGDAQREAAEEPPLPLRVGAVGLGQDPRRRALVDRRLLGQRRDLRDELDRARAGADHGHPAALEIDVVVPLGGVERGPGEVVDARDRRAPRAWRAARRPSRARRRRARRRRPSSASSARSPSSKVALSDLGAEAQVGAEPEARGAAPRDSGGSPPGARSGATSRGRGRTRTSRGARARRRRRRGMCSPATRRRPSRRARRS